MAPSKPSSVAALSAYTRLNSSIWYLQRSSITQNNNASALVVLLGWMGATPRHISKYTSKYESLYPSASILAITTSTVEAAATSETSNKRRLAPALEVIYNAGEEGKLLLHFFSNGGGMTARLLMKMYAEKKTGSSLLPVNAVVLDSCPGRATYVATIKAFSVALPKNLVLNFMGLLVLNIYWALYKVMMIATGSTDRVEQVRRDMNDKQLLRVEAKRLYMYSEADQMVAWQDVEEHAQEAEALGYKVSREKFGSSGHAGHVVVYPERYWEAVGRLWNSS